MSERTSSDGTQQICNREVEIVKRNGETITSTRQARRCDSINARGEQRIERLEIGVVVDRAKLCYVRATDTRATHCFEHEDWNSKKISVLGR